MSGQKGFSVVEGFLVLLMLGVACLGYYWVKNSNIVREHTATVSTAQVDASFTTASGLSQDYITIKEWNVRAKAPSAPSLEYAMDFTNTNRAAFTSAQLVAAGGADSCGNGTVAYGSSGTLQLGGGGFIERYAPTQQVQFEGGSDSGITAEQAAKIVPSSWARVGNYYFLYSRPKTLCSNKAKTIQPQTEAAVKTFLKSLQVAPADS